MPALVKHRKIDRFVDRGFGFAGLSRGPRTGVDRPHVWALGQPIKASEESLVRIRDFCTGEVVRNYSIRESKPELLGFRHHPFERGLS